MPPPSSTAAQPLKLPAGDDKSISNQAGGVKAPGSVGDISSPHELTAFVSIFRNVDFQSGRVVVLLVVFYSWLRWLPVITYTPSVMLPRLTDNVGI